jgi:hypothetical protein
MRFDRKRVILVAGLAIGLMWGASAAAQIKIDTPTPPPGCQFVGSTTVKPGKNWHGVKCVTNTNGCNCSGTYCPKARVARYRDVRCVASPG